MSDKKITISISLSCEDYEEMADDIGIKYMDLNHSIVKEYIEEVLGSYFRKIKIIKTEDINERKQYDRYK